jgi:hypothetical protein
MVTPTEKNLGLNIMRKCVYKKTNGLCSHPGNRNCCAAEETHTFFHKCDKNEKLGEFFYATKEQTQVLLRTLSQDLAVK